MSLFSIWPQLGFRENPYSNENLPSDEAGDYLLVGRDREVKEIQRKVGSGGTHPSVEGPAGVGKSSLLAVSGYRMLRLSVEANAGALYVPANRFFQASESVDDFEAEVYWEIAQTLIQHVEAFRRAGLSIPDIEGMDKWLNSPQYRNGQLSLGPIGAGGGSSPNEADGFSQSGFPAAVRAQLDRCFPTPATGGLVCVLDNLELLQTSAKARLTLEALRDRVFAVRGLRWVLCGSRGIVARARSQRLSGVFDPPLRLGPLPDDASVELVARRIDYYGEPDAYAPVPPQAFQFLYQALHSNLRDSMAYAQQFSDWLYGEYIARDKELPPLEDREPLLQVWITEIADEAHADARGVQRRVWQFFDKMAESGGTCRASDWEEFDFTTQQQLSSSVSALETANLVIRETDPDNASRSLASITPQGWLVHFYRNRYNLPSHTDA